MATWRKPAVSVLLSVYNGERYLPAAIESILAQTFADFELIAIDDGSTDSSATILSGYAAADPRVRVLSHQERWGLTRSLNQGLSEAEGELVARQDADDLSLPTRLARQVACVAASQQPLLVATGSEKIDAGGQVTSRHPLTAPSVLLRWQLLFNNQFCHSSVLFSRKAVAELGGYDETTAYAQDFELWSRLTRLGGLVAIPDVLVQWRQHPHNITAHHQETQEQVVNRVVARSVREVVGNSISDSEAATLRLAVRRKQLDVTNDLLAVAVLLNRFCLRICDRWALQPHERKLIQLECGQTLQHIASTLARSRRNEALRVLRMSVATAPPLWSRRTTYSCAARVLLG
ncbi:MAG: glycosyltransferase [Caldilineaceae bacterium]|nr:glycosyltransferase [Caldilineaceae bacterium]